MALVKHHKAIHALWAILSKPGELNSFLTLFQRSVMVKTFFRHTAVESGKHCDRLRTPVLYNGEFPMLEYLYIAPPAKHDSGFILSKTFRAPHLRHLVLKNFAFPIRSSLLTAGVGLTTLSLMNIHPSGYTYPNELLRQLSLMPQLETLGIFFHSPVFFQP